MQGIVKLQKIVLLPMPSKKTQMDLLKKYYVNNPNRAIPHKEVVDWVTKKWEKETGTVFRDPDRGIRKLHEAGFLIKVKKGCYKYTPSHAHNRTPENFSKKMRDTVLKRDGHKCVMCGRGEESGLELHVDHIKPKDKGGKATMKNGQTLCSEHNFLKKNFNQTETGKKMFIRLYEMAKSEGETAIMEFCAEVLTVYKKHNVNGHIPWERHQ